MRRERWGILGAILEAIEEESARGPDARVSNVAVKANLPYDRLLTYLQQLADAGLVVPGRMPTLTDRGREFLRHYRQWTDVLDRFGVK